MSNADREDVRVSVDGVTVRKSLDTDQFNPATVVFDVESTRNEPVLIRIREALPPGSSREQIGFHPDYGAEHWAVEDGDVVFERTLEPGEEYTTVYGVRDMDESARDALDDEPTVTVQSTDTGEASRPVDAHAGDTDEHAGDADDTADADDSDVPTDLTAGADGDDEPTANFADDDVAVDADDGTDVAVDADGDSGEADDAEAHSGIDDLVSPEDNQPVRDVITGERDALSGDAPDETEDESEEDVAQSDAESSSTPPSEDDDPSSGERTSAIRQRPEATDDADGAGADEADEIDADASDVEAEAADADAADATTPSAESSETDEATTSAEPPGSVAERLAEELRSGDVSDRDRERIREALADETDSASTDARIEHLQTQVSDLAAYTEALEAFLDEEGTAQQLLDDLSDRQDAFDDRLAAAESEVAAIDDRVEGLDERADDLADRVDSLDAKLTAVDGQIDDLDDRTDRHADRLDDLDETTASESAVEAVRDDVDDLATDVATLRDDVAGIESFRERLETVLAQPTAAPEGGDGSTDNGETEPADDGDAGSMDDDSDESGGDWAEGGSSDDQ